jgi:hypothetical protein
VKVPTERLITFNTFPAVLKMRYVEFDDSSLGRVHTHCADNFTSRASQITLEGHINSAEKFVELVTLYRVRFWYAHGSKALFPSPSLVQCRMLII